MLNLTEMEQRILNHRLEVPDAIADAIEAGEDDEVGAVCDKLIAGDLDGANAIDADLTKYVLADAVEGSTYLACADGALSGGETTPQKYGAECRVGRSLAKKISAYVGQALRIPER